MWPKAQDEPTHKVDRLASRVVPLEETVARVEAFLDAVPVTRISDLMALDELCLPVCCAVTPLARDLTTHLGKGPTPLAARVSALMEAVERVSAEDVPVAAPTVRASFIEMRARELDAVDPCCA